MSVICQTFVQNAWRSDLCSNCFKCRDEHDSSDPRMITSHRYMPQATSLYQSRGISSNLKWRLSEPIYERVARRDFGSQTLIHKTSHHVGGTRIDERRSRGILVKTKDRRQRSRSCVDFSSEEALVIGYGGNDYDSDQSPWEMASDDESVDLEQLDDNEEDRSITRMTKDNTEFNSSNRNLSVPPPDDKLKVRNGLTSSQKREEDKKNSINNNKTVGSPQKTPDRSLNILTYNDIQKPEKKLNQYYFPSATEQHSFLHNGHKVANVNETTRINHVNGKTNNSQNVSEKTTNVHIDNPKVNNYSNNSNGNLIKDEFTPLNTKTYSFVSELSKTGHLSSEHSSDSDYSTCRLTAGDSTDSESFQDAEESRILPCASFLHGNFPPQQKTILQQSLNSLESDKKYDAGSSTSGDVSNLSDDSDAASERTSSYKSRNARLPKTEERRFDTEDDTRLEKKTPLPLKHKQTDIEESPMGKKTAVSTREAVANIDEKSRCNPSPINSEKIDVIPISVDLKNDHKAGDNKTISSPAPNPPVDINLRNIIAINDCSTAQKGNVIPNGHPSVTKTKSSPPRLTNTPEKQVTTRVNEVPKSREPKPDNEIREPDRIQADEPFYKDHSDDDDYEKSPEAINDRQSKLAALALELEMARRDSALKSGRCDPPPSLPAPPEGKAANFCTIKQQGSAVSCTSRMVNTLPDVLQETPPSTTKSKKGRFSLKKLLKRSKDSQTFTPAIKEVNNPKAWKKQTFDRSRMSLEIVHPMDLQQTTSGESTPSEESQYSISNHPDRSIFKGGYSRARSLSALPQMETLEQSNCSLLECRKMETLPTRKAGTVAERKKNRPSLVRTPSCSAIPHRPQQDGDAPKAPPPKPPPPPKHKVMHPPPPPPPQHPHPRRAPNTPNRPPPPKIPESKCRTPSGDASKQDYKEYANLGDIRSLLTPVKPQRPSALSVPPREGEMDHKKDHETPQEDHYTYLDDVEARRPKKSSSCGSVVSSNSFKQQQQSDQGRPWIDLQTSYAAIAATNYESLTEIIATSLNETVFGKSLKWKDFLLESDQPQVLFNGRSIFHATYKPQYKDNIMLMVTPRKQGPPHPRHQARYPLLATFEDHIGQEYATVHVLPRSSVSTLGHFSCSSSKSEDGEQAVHLRDHCFVLLQLLHVLKGLQAEGVEEVSGEAEDAVLLVGEDPPVLVLTPEDRARMCEGGNKTLCQATLDTLYHFLQVSSADELSTCTVNGEPLVEPVAHTFRVIATVLSEEKASSLSQAKGLLEYMLWGPVDLHPSVDDTVLQRWLDLQRAQMVRAAVARLQHGRARLGAYEEYQLVFLLQATVKSLKGVISKL